MLKWTILVTVLVAAVHLQCYGRVHKSVSVFNQPDLRVFVKSGGTPRHSQGQSNSQNQALYPNQNVDADFIADDAEKHIYFDPDINFAQLEGKESGYQLPFKDTILQGLSKLRNYGNRVIDGNYPSGNTGLMSRSLPSSFESQRNDYFSNNKLPLSYKVEYPGKDLEPINNKYHYNDNILNFDYFRTESEQYTTTEACELKQEPQAKCIEIMSPQKTTLPPAPPLPQQCKPKYRPRPKIDSSDVKVKPAEPPSEPKQEDPPRCPPQTTLTLPPTTLPSPKYCPTPPPKWKPPKAKIECIPESETPKPKPQKKPCIRPTTTTPPPSHVELPCFQMELPPYRALESTYLKKQYQPHLSRMQLPIGSESQSNSQSQPEQQGKKTHFRVSLPFQPWTSSQSYQSPNMNLNLKSQQQSQSQSQGKMETHPEIFFNHELSSNNFTKNDGSRQIDINIEVGNHESFDRWLQLLHKIKRHAICAISNANDFEVKMLSAGKNQNCNSILDVASIRDELSRLLGKSDPAKPEEAPAPAAYLLPNEKKDDHVVKDNQRRIYYKQLELDKLQQHEQVLREEQLDEQLRIQNKMLQDQQLKEKLQKALMLKQQQHKHFTENELKQLRKENELKMQMKQKLQEKMRQEIREKDDRWQKQQQIKLQQEQKEKAQVAIQQQEQKEIMKEQHETLRLLERLREKEREIEKWQLQEQLQQKQQEIEKLKQEKMQQKQAEERHSVELQLEYIPNDEVPDKTQQQHQEQLQHHLNSPEHKKLMTQQQLQAQLQCQLQKQEKLQKDLVQRQKQQEKLHEQLLHHQQKQVKMHQEAEWRHQQQMKLRQEQRDKWENQKWRPPPKIGRLELQKSSKFGQQELKKLQEQQQEKQEGRELQQEHEKEQKQQQEQKEITNYYEKLQVADKILKDRLKEEELQQQQQQKQQQQTEKATKISSPKEKWQMYQKIQNPSQHQTFKYPNPQEYNKNSQQRSKWYQQMHDRLEQLKQRHQQGKLKVFLELKERKQRLLRQQQQQQERHQRQHQKYQQLIKQHNNKHHHYYYPKSSKLSI